jgi:hypothetical protein
MAKPTIETQIQARIQTFTAELTELIKEAALQSVSDALRSPVTSAMRGSARLTRSNAIALRAGHALATRAAGAKRTAAELDELSERLFGFIADNPGQRTEQIGAALGIPTKELVLPMRKLLRDGRLKTKGQKRATSYFVK